MAEPPVTKHAHIAILSGPGAGHLFPSSELAKLLVRRHDITITFITQSIGSPSTAEQSIINDLPDKINIVIIPALPPDVLPNKTHPLPLVFFMANHNVSYLRTVLTTLTAASPPLTALIVDMFFAEATYDVAAELGVQTYMFFTSGCMLLSLSLNLPALDKMYVGEYTDISEPLLLHGGVKLHGRDMPDTVIGRESEEYASFLSIVKRYTEAKGILVNSFVELEPEILKAMREDKSLPPVYPVGPVVRSSSTGRGSSINCLEWLDEQPESTVLYVSFGSGGTLTGDQMKELALGLELSGHRFMWVVKSPHERDAFAAHFAADGQFVPGQLDFLPDGFLDRTKHLGLVVTSWTPQVDVLGHSSVGGFMTHCGWNSTLESVVKRVPMIVWPLYAEQKMNATMLAEEVGVALRAKAVDSMEIVGREEIAKVVKCLMGGEEGKKVRNRMREISREAARAVEEGGSSFKSVDAVVERWKLGLKPSLE